MCLVLSVTLVVATVCAADRLALVMMRCCARATVANAPDHKYNIYAKHFRVIHTHTTTHDTNTHHHNVLCNNHFYEAPKARSRSVQNKRH